jgi:hypothetical protein
LTSREFAGPVDIGCSWIHGYREGSVVRELTDELGVVSRERAELSHILIY